MSKQITFDVVSRETNLQLDDQLVYIENKDTYDVAYIDLNKVKAVLVNSGEIPGWLVIDLRQCDDFEII